MYTKLLIVATTIMACSGTKKENSNLAGEYEVRISLGENLINKEALSDSISSALNQAKVAIEGLDSSEELDLTKIDTSTAEGKIEYAAKQFAKQMAKLGSDVGGLSVKIGEISTKAIEGSLNLADDIIKNVSFDISLNADGTISGNKTGLGKWSFDHAKWSQEGNTIYLMNSDGNNKEAFEISEFTNEGFILSKEKIKFIFVRK